MNTENEIILFQWNIVELDDELAIFVGLRDKPDKYSRDTASDYLFRHSTPVESFDEVTGIGVTKSGVFIAVWVCRVIHMVKSVR